jgi:hypothetical protein
MLENDSSESVLTWGLNGTTFIVRDTMEFSRTVLPKHFKHSNFASFVRQLNKYDFHKVRQVDDSRKSYDSQVPFFFTLLIFCLTQTHRHGNLFILNLFDIAKIY